MRLGLIAALVLVAACQQEAVQAPAEAELPVAPIVEADTNGCPAQASSAWGAYAVEAVASGSACAQASVVLTIRGERATLYSETYNAAQVMVLAEARSAEDMERMLRDWITPHPRAWDSTGDLPVWQANEMSPTANAEFPFYPEEGVDRARYEAIRRSDAPMFCFVQGMESQACVLVENGEITKIGVQSFPG